MYVSDLYISNYKSIRNIHIPLGIGKNVIVGKNNSGKSNIIQALDIILGEKAPTNNTFAPEDFHVSHQNQCEGNRVADDLFIAVKLSGGDLDSSELNKVNYIREQRFTHKRWLQYSEDDEFDLAENFKKEIDSFESRDFDTYKSEQLTGWGNEVKDIILYTRVFRDEDFNIEVINGLAVNKEQYDEYHRCYPVSNKLRDAFITSAVVPAYREPNKELKVSKWNWYGKLIKEIWNNRSEELNSEMESINERLSAIGNTVFTNTSYELEKILHSLFKFQDVSFKLLPKDNKELYRNVKLYVNDGVESLLSDKGTGIQSVIIITLFKYYCDNFHKHHSSLLAVEEPELYLHPHSRRMLSNELDDFVAKGRNQVIITSHNSDFLRNTEIENIIVVRKSSTDYATQVFKLKDTNEKVQEVQKIKQFLWGRNSEIFFASKVILVEGGEEYIIPLIADLMFNKNGISDIENISVINVGGKSQFRSYIKLFKDLSIDYRIIADFDYLETGVEQLSEFSSHIDESRLSEIRKELNRYKEGFEKNRKIKNKILSEGQQDAQALCYLLDEVCEREQYVDGLKELWAYLRPKVSKKVNYKDFDKEDSITDLIDDFLSDLRQDNIVILKGGELEDFYKEEAHRILDEKRVKGKELKVLKLAELIRSGEHELTDLLIVKEYAEAIYDFISVKPVCEIDNS